MKILILSLLSLVLCSCNVVNLVSGDDAKIDSAFGQADNNQDHGPHQCIQHSSDADGLSLSTGLLEFFHFDENSGQRNGIKGNFNLIETGSVASEPGICGNALDTTSFDNSNDLSPSDHTKLAFGTTNFSIAFWIKFEPATNGYQFIQGDDDGGSVDMYIGAYISGSAVQLEVWMAGNVFTIPNFLSTDDQWHHVALVFDRTTDSRVYRDGLLHQTNAAATNGNNLNTTITEQIGGRKYGATMTPVKGALDEYGLWTKALTPGEVSKLYKKEYNF